MITTFDVRWACDVLRPVYDATDGRRRPGVDRGRPPPRARHRADRRRSPPAVVARRPAQPVHQDPGDDRRSAGDHPMPGRGHQHQRDADLLPAALRRGDGRLPRRHRASPRRGPRPDPAGLGRVVLRQPRRHRDRPAASTRSARPRRKRSAAGRDRERPTGLPQPTTRSSPPPMAHPRPGRGPAAAAAVGLHRGEGPGLPRHPLRRRPGHPRRGEHHARGDAARDGRPRRPARRHRPPGL